MSQSDSTAVPQQSHVLFNGPTFHVSGVQVVSDTGEISLYLTATRHAFNTAGTQVRTVNEIVARLTMSPSGVERIAETLRNYIDQQKRPPQ
jgi:hypothetical protein